MNQLTLEKKQLKQEKEKAKKDPRYKFKQPEPYGRGTKGLRGFLTYYKAYFNFYKIINESDKVTVAAGFLIDDALI